MPSDTHLDRFLRAAIEQCGEGDDDVRAWLTALLERGEQASSDARHNQEEKNDG